MGFQIGDKVIHSTYGLGEIKDLQNKTIRGASTNCYMIWIGNLNLQIWVPINNVEQQTLRVPAPPEEFERLAVILTRPGEALPEDRLLRKSQLQARIRDGQLASICAVVRDLTYYKRTSKLNEQENAILERAMNSLLIEWSYSHGISMHEARLALTNLLRANAA